MAYDPNHPPGCTAQRVGSKGRGGAIFAYGSNDDLTAVLAADYFTDGADHGMELGDIVHVHEIDTVITSICYVKAIDAAGAVTVVAVA